MDIYYRYSKKIVIQGAAHGVYGLVMVVAVSVVGPYFGKKRYFLSFT